MPAGWRYNGSGSAAAIPQAHFDGEQVERTATASKRSCVATYPTQVKNHNSDAVLLCALPRNMFIKEPKSKCS